MEYKKLAKKTHQYLRKRQNPDGSWYYAHGERATFIDGFHTGYILEGMSRGILNGCIDADDTFNKGVSFYLDNFFTPDFTPKYFHNSIAPYDIQNGAQAIQTLLFLYKLNFVSFDFVQKVARRVDNIFWNEKGYYDFSKNKTILYSTPMHRWATGPMLLALSFLMYETEMAGKEEGVYV